MESNKWVMWARPRYPFICTLLAGAHHACGKNIGPDLRLRWVGVTKKVVAFEAA